MIWIELLVAVWAGGVALCFSLAIAAMARSLEKKQRGKRAIKKRLPYLESAPIGADDVHLADVVSGPHEEEVVT